MKQPGETFFVVNKKHSNSQNRLNKVIKKLNYVNRRMCLGMLLSVVAIQNAVADAIDDWPERFSSIGVEVGYNIAGQGNDADGQDNIEDYPEYGVSLQHQFARNASWLIQVSQAQPQTTDSETKAELSRGYLGVRYHAQKLLFNEWRQFIGFGFNYTDHTVEATDFDNSENAFYLSLGFQNRLSERWLLEAGARVRAEINEGYFDGQPFLGLRYLFNRTYPAVATMEQQAPAPMVIQAPSDRDQDGVIDRIDLCPSTPPGAVVDSDGCAKTFTETINQSLYLDFETNSSALVNADISNIETLALIANKYPNASIFINGHTDNVGSAEYNMRLSLARARSVQDIFIGEFDIPSSRIVVTGSGETNPIASNETEKGRATNRRVEIVISAEETRFLSKEF